MAKKDINDNVILKSQNAISSWGGRRTMPFAFTELGVAMLSSVLTSKEAIEVTMRRFLVSNAQVFQRLDNLEYKLIATDEKVALLYDKIEEGKLEPRQGIFFDGQIIRSIRARLNINAQIKEVWIYDGDSVVDIYP